MLRRHRYTQMLHELYWGFTEPEDNDELSDLDKINKQHREERGKKYLTAEKDSYARAKQP